MRIITIILVVGFCGCATKAKLDRALDSIPPLAQSIEHTADAMTVTAGGIQSNGLAIQETLQDALVAMTMTTTSSVARVTEKTTQIQDKTMDVLTLIVKILGGVLLAFFGFSKHNVPSLLRALVQPKGDKSDESQVVRSQRSRILR